MVVEVLGREGGVNVVMTLRRKMERRRVKLLESVVGGVCSAYDIIIGGGVFGSFKGYVGNGIAHHIILYLPIASSAIFSTTPDSSGNKQHIYTHHNRR